LILAEAVGTDSAEQMLQVWLETSFDGGRHQRRLELIRCIEAEQFKIASYSCKTTKMM
jgi:ribose 5-phosphate isomerase RpiB